MGRCQALARRRHRLRTSQAVADHGARTYRGARVGFGAPRWGALPYRYRAVPWMPTTTSPGRSPSTAWRPP
jgi:hypothetical protein